MRITSTASVTCNGGASRIALHVTGAYWTDWRPRRAPCNPAHLCRLFLNIQVVVTVPGAAQQRPFMESDPQGSCPLYPRKADKQQMARFACFVPKADKCAAAKRAPLFDRLVYRAFPGGTVLAFFDPPHEEEPCRIILTAATFWPSRAASLVQASSVRDTHRPN